MNFTYWDSQQNEENNEKTMQIKQLKKKKAENKYSNLLGFK